MRVSYDVNKAETDVLALTLDTYPGENISDFATEAQTFDQEDGRRICHSNSYRITVVDISLQDFQRRVQSKDFCSPGLGQRYGIQV
jgi:hypothetical protein